MKSRIIILVGILNFCFAVSGKAQDLHFSQFFNSPLTTNPANTGFIPEGDYRLGVNFRNQWSSVMTLPYKTMSAFGDFQLMKPGDEQSDKGWWGVGAVILRDVAGGGGGRGRGGWGGGDIPAY